MEPVNMSDINTLDKIAALPRILEAARTLWLWGLQKEQPAETVKRFVNANPDINERLSHSASGDANG
jgi:hypothetical protein